MAKIDEIIKQVAKEEGLSESVVRDIHRAIWVISKKIMQTSEAPRVTLANFGRFFPCLGKLERGIYRANLTAKRKPSAYNSMKALITRHYRIRRRILNEHIAEYKRLPRRNGKYKDERYPARHGS